MQIPSKLIEDCVQAFAALPGIGKKTALRLTLHLLNQEEADVERFSETVARMRREVRFCGQCHNICDHDLDPDEKPLCQICRNPARDQSVICIVENLRDLIAIESTGQFKGTYHLLGGVISPVEGVGPEDINLASLVKRIKKGGVDELIMALSPNIEGDTTIFYISKKVADRNIRITTIARGIAFGGELEYVDEMTLSRSLANRLPYESYLVKK